MKHAERRLLTLVLLVFRRNQNMCFYNVLFLTRVFLKVGLGDYVRNSQVAFSKKINPVI